MKESFYNIVLHNLLDLYQAPTQSFRKEDFESINGTSSRNEDVMLFLVENDLIEFEDDKRLYFLAPDTYNLIESYRIEDVLWNLISEEEREKHRKLLEFNEAKKERLFYRSIEPEIKPQKAPLLSKTPTFFFRNDININCISFLSFYST